MQDQTSEVSFSPSFNSYSSDSLAETAAKVSREFCKLNLETSGDAPPPEFHGVADDEDDDFEFVSLSTAGDEVFLKGAQIGPVFPVFNRDLLLGDFDDGSRSRLGLRDENEVPDPPSSSSSSSSEVDELDGIPEGTYCVWTPKGVPPSRARCEKSKSAGSSSSRRWRFRDLLRRSHSDGKDSFVFLTPSFGSRKVSTEENKTTKTEEKPIGNRGSGGSGVSSAAAIGGGKGKKNMAAAHEVFYVKNKALNPKEKKKRSTFLPYRQDLVGFFANANAMGRNFPPF